MYIVVRMFHDAEDELHRYEVGDKYPRKGRGKAQRIKELSSANNALGIPLIEEVLDDGQKQSR